MSKKKDLVKNTGILFMGRISTQFVSFILLPLYTAKLTTSEYGTLDLYTTVAGIIMPILTLQLEQAIFRYLITSEEDENKIISSAVLFIFFSSIVMTIVYIPICKVLSIEFAYLVDIYYVTMLFSTVLQQVPRGYGNYTLYTLTAFLSSTISIVFSVLFISCFNKRIDGILIARILSQIFVVLFVFQKLHLIHKINIRYFSVKILKAMLKYSSPLVFNQFASWIVNYSDRIIIIAVLGVSTNGIYAIANKFFNLIVTTINVYNIAWTESVTKALGDKDRNKYYNSTFNFTFVLFFLASAGIICTIGIFFKYLININYNYAYYHIPILIYAAMFSGLSANIGSIYVAYKMTKEISYTTFMTAIINIIVHILLIKFIHLYAASISTLVSFAVMFVYRIFKLRNTEKIYLNLKAVIPQIPFALFVLIAYYLRYLYLQIIAMLLISAYSFYFILSSQTVKSYIINNFKYNKQEQK